MGLIDKQEYGNKLIQSMVDLLRTCTRSKYNPLTKQWLFYYTDGTVEGVRLIK